MHRPTEERVQRREDLKEQRKSPDQDLGRSSGRVTETTITDLLPPRKKPNKTGVASG